MRRIMRSAIPILLMFVILLVGCSNKDDQPTANPAFTDIPEGQGTAILVYTLSSEQSSSGFKSSSDIGIPISIFIDPDNPKKQAVMAGSNMADFFLQVGGMDQGVMCFNEFAYLVEYEVIGVYNPGPKCDFDVKITGKVMDGEVKRSGNCSFPIHETYPAQLVFAPPPLGPLQNGMHKIPGSLPVVTILDNGETKITIELINVVVPTSSGCYFGG